MAAVVCGCRPAGDTGIAVVASTSNITAIVTAVGGERVSVTAIAPAGLCPGHFDLKPSDIAAANRADLLLNQGWELWFPELRKAVTNPEVRLVTAESKGNWMLPEVHKLAVEEIAGLLAAIDTTWADTFHRRAVEYRRRVDSVWNEAKSLLEDRSRPKVMASDRQVEFLELFGFEVVASYGRPEEIGAREMAQLAQVGVDDEVGLVVDNLQSSPDAMLELARALGAKHLNLTNFPQEDDYPATLLGSVRDLAAVLE